MPVVSTGELITPTPIIVQPPGTVDPAAVLALLYGGTPPPNLPIRAPSIKSGADGTPVIRLGPQRLGTDSIWGPIHLPDAPYDPTVTLTAAIWPKGGRFSVPAIPYWKDQNGPTTGLVNLWIPRVNTGPLSPGENKFSITLNDGDSLVDEVDGFVSFRDPVPPTYSPSGILTVSGTEWVIVNRRMGWLLEILPKTMNSASYYGNNVFVDMAIGSALDFMGYRRTDLYGISDADLARVPVADRQILENAADYFTITQLLGNFAQVDVQDQNFLTRYDELRTAMERERNRVYRLFSSYGSGYYEVGVMRPTGECCPWDFAATYERVCRFDYGFRFGRRPGWLGWPWLVGMH